MFVHLPEGVVHRFDSFVVLLVRVRVTKHGRTIMFRLFRFDLLIFGSVCVHTNLIWRRGVITRGAVGRSLSNLLMGLQRQREPIYIQRWGPSGRVQVQSSVLTIQRQPLAPSAPPVPPGSHRSPTEQKHHAAAAAG